MLTLKLEFAFRQCFLFGLKTRFCYILAIRKILLFQLADANVEQDHLHKLCILDSTKLCRMRQ